VEILCHVGFSSRLKTPGVASNGSWSFDVLPSERVLPEGAWSLDVLLQAVP
jgi:hypothetical protein